MENDIVDTVTYGLSASEEGEVVKNITSKFILDARATVSVGEKAKYVLLWKMCREAMVRGDLAGSHAIDDGKAMSQPESTTLKKKWKDTHSFLFTAPRSLTPLIVAKMFKHATACPKQFVVLYPEDLKLMAAFVKTDGTTLQFTAGQLPQAINNNVEAVTAISTFRNKIEAQFNMWAFVSIQDPAWFSLQDAVNFLDLINEFFERRYRGGSRPTLEFYKVAYVKTMNVFLEAVSTHERKLSDIVKEVASWSSAWTSWDPPHVNNYGRGAGKGGDTASPHVIPQHINRVMNKMGKMAMNMKNSMSKQYSPYGQGKGQWQQDRYHQYQPYTYQSEWTPPAYKQEGDKGGKPGKGKGKGKKPKKGKGKQGGW